MISRRAWLGATATALLAAACSKKSAAPLRVAAAADLAGAFEEVGAAFTADHGPAVSFTFGSSGLLARQIEEGAPFDVFAAANVAFVDGLIARGKGRAETRSLYARGRIVIFVAEGGVAAPSSLADLVSPRFRTIAVANPEHAPYGQAALQSLGKAGVLDAVRPRLVYGENVQQALRYATSGNADVAIVGDSLARTARGSSIAIDESTHDPIDQAMVVCSGSARLAEATAFVRFVAAPRGREIMRRRGFVLPGEAVPASSG